MLRNWVFLRSLSFHYLLFSKVLYYCHLEKSSRFL